MPLVPKVRNSGRPADGQQKGRQEGSKVGREAGKKSGIQGCGKAGHQSDKYVYKGAKNKEDRGRNAGRVKYKLG